MLGRGGWGMSIRLMSAVWTMPLPPAHKLVLLALSDWADDQGGQCWPSLEKIAARASISARQAQRHMRTLEVGGWLAVASNHRGGHQSRRYQVNAPRIYQLSLAASDDRGDTYVTPDNAAYRGDTFVTPSENRDDTDVTPGVTPKVRRGDTNVTRSTMTHHVSSSSVQERGADAAAAPAERKRKRTDPTTGISYWYQDEHDRIDQLAASFGIDAVRNAVAALSQRGADPLPNAVELALQAARRASAAAQPRRAAPAEDRADAAARSQALMAAYSGDTP